MKCSMAISEFIPNHDVVSLDQVRMRKTAAGLLLILEASLPAGCSEWAARCRPDIARYLAEGVERMRKEAAAGDRDGAIAAFNYCTKLFPKVASIYRRESASGISDRLEGIRDGGTASCAV